MLGVQGSKTDVLAGLGCLLCFFARTTQMTALLVEINAKLQSVPLKPHRANCFNFVKIPLNLNIFSTGLGEESSCCGG
jgi:hypothetical protein